MDSQGSVRAGSIRRSERGAQGKSLQWKQVLRRWSSEFCVPRVKCAQVCLGCHCCQSRGKGVGEGRQRRAATDGGLGVRNEMMGVAVRDAI